MLRAAFAEKFTSLLSSPKLIDVLMADDGVAFDICARPQRCAALLEMPYFRNELVNTPGFMKLLFGSDDEMAPVRRREVFEELDGGNDLETIFKSSAFVTLVREHPLMFDRLIGDLELRSRLSESRAVRDFFLKELALPKLKPGSKRSPKTNQNVIDIKRGKIKDAVRHGTALREIADFRSLDLALEKASEYTKAPEPIGIARGNALLLEAAFEKWIGVNRSVTAALRRMHNEGMAAVCLSGGGIRSATFNLGILQALAKRGVLKHFNYLSTVSGGGYIGAWLSSWMRRHVEGADGALTDIASRTGDPIEAEPEPLRYLRDYSRYLAPRAGIFTVDLWTIIAIYTRNLLLNWTLLLPPLFALLLLPRFAEWLLIREPLFGPKTWTWTSSVLMVASMVLFAIARPKVQVVTGMPLSAEELRRQRRWTMAMLLPIIATSVILALGTGWFLHAHRIAGGQRRWVEANVGWVAAAFIAANFIGATVYFVLYAHSLATYDDPELARLYRRKWEIWSLFRRAIKRGGIELIGALLAAAIPYAILKLGVPAAAGSSPPLNLGLIGAELFVCFGVPLVIVVFVLEGAVLLGTTTKVSSEHEREWVARAAAGMMLAAITWVVVAGTALLVPIALYQSPKIFAALGGLSGLVALITGKSAKSTANVTTRETTAIGRSFSIVVGTAASVALIILGGFVSMLTTEFIRPRPGNVTLAPTRTAQLRVNTTIIPGNATEYSVKVTSAHESSLATLGTSALRHIEALRTGSGPLWLLLLWSLEVSLLASSALDVNTYSMHSMYRNRLIRAYLGASRRSRRPHPFTGFDPQDDLQMHQLRPDLLWPGAFRDFAGFIRRLTDEGKRGGVTLWGSLKERFKATADKLLANPTEANLNDLQPILIGGLNDLMQERDFEHGFVAAVGTPSLLRCNRNWINDRYRDFLKPIHNKPPLHVINIALNLVRGEKLAWQQRKAESFTISPLHAGSHRIGYRDTREYGGADGGISLGTAVAISGAAVSPNMGYHSTGAVTALMTFFNARLGWWLGNPGPIGEVTFAQSGPSQAIEPLFREAAGLTNDQSSWVFLSDGGHFENLGLYEMVLRRCRYIIVCDATADDRYAFNDLANAVRKIRIDLGIPIDFESIRIAPPDEEDPASARALRYCAVGWIRYSAVDDPSAPPMEAKDGRLVYIKPVVYPDCPVDIRNYRTANPLFPHESTGDQFFNETQFESYRALGAHCVDTILGTAKETLDTDAFFEAAARYAAEKEKKAGSDRFGRLGKSVHHVVIR
ncbi:MAG TPA: patatin-like phospholipase family protein [Thermoanaerobaculia bacterium]|nr:patatin-like phospholipase family protein [Thermoanaerobaculia bacterium]